MKRFFILLFLISGSLTAQQNFVWLTDLHIGRDSSAAELEVIVNKINALHKLDFVLATGSITEHSKISEFDKAKEILDNLEKPLLVLPGFRDSKWSNSGCAKFYEIWEEDKFIYKKGNTVFIGMNSTIPFQSGGHFRPEDIKWLKEELAKTDSTYEIVFVTHYPFTSIDNWKSVANILNNYKIKILLAGSADKIKSVNFNGITSIIGKETITAKPDSNSFMLIKNKRDSLKFYVIGKDTLTHLSLKINSHPSVFKIPNKKTAKPKRKYTEFLFDKNIKTTLIAPPLFWKGKIFTADYTGLVSCFNMHGKLLWDYDTFGDITGQPVITERKLLVTTVQGELTILDTKNGEQIETIGFDDYIVAPPVIFNHTGIKNLLIRKQTKSNTAIILATTNGKIYCYDLETLQEIWKNNDAEGMIQAPPIVIGNQIIFGSADSYLYSLDADNGTTIWKWHAKESRPIMNTPASSVPTTDGKYLYLSTPNGYLYSIDLRLGITKWIQKKYNATEAVGISLNKKRLFIKSKRDKIFIISTKNGKPFKSVTVKYGTDTFPSRPIEWNKKIVFTSANGKIYRINRKYRYRTLLYLGNAPLHSIQKIDGKRLMASNIDGRIVVFNIINDK